VLPPYLFFIPAKFIQFAVQQPATSYAKRSTQHLPRTTLSMKPRFILLLCFTGLALGTAAQQEGSKQAAAFTGYQNNRAPCGPTPISSCPWAAVGRKLESCFSKKDITINLYFCSYKRREIYRGDADRLHNGKKTETI
jgi:hypothetical protein